MTLTGQILEISDPRWLEFSTMAPNACIFHHPAWSMLLAQTYSFRPFALAATDEGGNLRAGLPVMAIKSITSRRWTSLPFTDYCAPLYMDDVALEYITSYALTAYQNLGPANLELRFSYPIRSLLRPKEMFVTHNLVLGEDFDAVARQVHSMHRRNARTAQKRGVRIHSGVGIEELKEFYGLHLETRQRQGAPIQPWSFFENLRTQVLDKGLGFISLAYYEQTCLAAAIFLHLGNTLTYKYGASSIDGLSLRPNHLIFWEAIRWGCEHGYQVLDFGRTDFDNTGLREFKSRWGAQEIPLVYTFVPEAPNGHESRLMSLAQAVIRNSPKFVCRVAGELLYRYFG